MVSTLVVFEEGTPNEARRMGCVTPAIKLMYL